MYVLVRPNSISNKARYPVSLCLLLPLHTSVVVGFIVFVFIRHWKQECVVSPPPSSALTTAKREVKMTKFRKLGRPTGHRMSMLRTMVSQLVKHERIETTVAKAKEVRRLADNMVQLGKEGSLCAARRAAAFVRGDDVLHKLFTELAYRYKDRAGGYTRLLRTRIRVGDAAPMAYIEFIDRENELRQAKPPTPQQPQRAPLDPWTRSRLTRQFAPPKVDKSQDSDL